MEPIYLLQVGKEVKAEEEAVVVSVVVFGTVSFWKKFNFSWGNVRWQEAMKHATSTAL